jgi:hypothetical protein
MTRKLSRARASSRDRHAARRHRTAVTPCVSDFTSQPAQVIGPIACATTRVQPIGFELSVAQGTASFLIAIFSPDAPSDNRSRRGPPCTVKCGLVTITRCSTDKRTPFDFLDSGENSCTNAEKAANHLCGTRLRWRYNGVFTLGPAGAFSPGCCGPMKAYLRLDSRSREILIPGRTMERSLNWCDLQRQSKSCDHAGTGRRR